MARPDDTTSGGYQDGSSDTDTGDKGGTGTGSQDGGTYPKYTIRFDGTLVPESPRVVKGPHTFVLLEASGKVTLALSRNPANPDEPDLTITIEEHQ
jgi:hypothetical protein